MRAKAFVSTYNNEPVLVDCIPMKIGYCEGFLHKGVDDNTKWTYSEFTTGTAVRYEYDTKEAVIQASIDKLNSVAEDYFRSLLTLPVINKTYVDYVPQTGDVVRIVEPHCGRIGRYDGDDIIGTVFTVSSCIRDFVDFRGSLKYSDGDFIPVTALDEPVPEVPQQRLPKAGDWVEITKSPTSGASYRDQFVGIKLKIVEWNGVNDTPVFENVPDVMNCLALMDEIITLHGGKKFEHSPVTVKRW